MTSRGALRIENRSIQVPLAPDVPRLTALAAALPDLLPPHHHPLRFSITSVEGRSATLEATLVAFDPDGPWAATLAEVEAWRPRRKQRQRTPFCAVQVIPTGIRCEFGGFAGDACPATNLLAGAVDCLVTHPNAVNASDLNEMAANVLYVEGRALDDFLLGHLALLPALGNKVGTVIDPTGEAYFDFVTSVLNAAAATAGIDCGLHAVLEEELGIQVGWSPSGCAVGSVAKPEALLAGVQRVIDGGAEAVGAVSVIHGSSEELFQQHLKGALPNPSGGVEAIVTHLITKLFRVPTAHAPLPYYQEVKGSHTSNARAAAEFISIPHYFSVLKGLARAPQLLSVDAEAATPSDAITLDHVGAVVVPASALGGIPALAAEFSGIPLIAVRENRTILELTNEKMQMQNVIEVESYLEAAGVLLALRKGIALASLRRPLRSSEVSLERA